VWRRLCQPRISPNSGEIGWDPRVGFRVNPGGRHHFHPVRNIAGEIERIAGGKFVCHTVNNEPHFAFENVNDLLLWVRVRRHDTPGRQRGEHLIHRFAVCDRAARDAGTNFNCRVLSFHFRILR